jgi:uncharacterized DUF497 family protein
MDFNFEKEMENLASRSPTFKDAMTTGMKDMMSIKSTPNGDVRAASYMVRMMSLPKYLLILMFIASLVLLFIGIRKQYKNEIKRFDDEPLNNYYKYAELAFGLIGVLFSGYYLYYMMRVPRG